MTDFVQLWVYLSSTPLFGLNATLVVYVLALAFYTRMEQAPWANPVLWSMVVLGLGLLATGTAFPTYFAGAQFIHFLLGPAVVALAWPLWERRAELRVRWGRFTWAWPGPWGCPWKWCYRWHPSRSPPPWRWALPTRLAAMPRWPQFLLW